MHNLIILLRSAIQGKKGIIGQVISVFVLMLVISTLAGLTFLFVSSLKDQIEATATGGNQSTAYLGINRTEAAGYQVTSYLGILFLALIFGAVLTVILRMIIPYVNLGQQIGGF